MKQYDVIVIGAGFAGLSSALTLAKHGLNVCVIEKKKKIGEPVQTTGIFIQSLIDSFLIPKEFIENEVKGMFIYSPSEKCYTIKLKTPRFYMMNISRFQKWLANECRKWNVDFYLNTYCDDINIKKTKVKTGKIESKATILACGSDINLIKKLTSDYVKNFLIGMEFIGRGINARNTRYFEIFMDYDIAPGYSAWIAPIRRDITHIGLCRYSPCDKNIKEELLEYFKRRIKTRFTIKEIRSSLIPISGPIAKTYGDRFLIVGDAAGQVGAMTAGGIYYALNIGKIAGRVLADNIGEPFENKLIEYEEIWKRRFGKSLRFELLLRSLWDKMDSNEEIEELLELLDQPHIMMEIKNVLKGIGLDSFNLFQEILFILLRDPLSGMEILKNMLAEKD